MQEQFGKIVNNPQGVLNFILNTALQVITKPVDFYRTMPKSGGFIEPLIFAVAMGVVSGLLQSIMAVFGLGMVGSFFMALASVIITPIMIAIAGFIGAAILFFIWKMMGSQEPYETAYRCGAYTAAISPITTLFNIIPYLGPVLGLLWMIYLIVVASTEVHGIRAQKAWIVFGILFGILAASSVGSQMAARRMESQMENFQKHMGADMEKMKDMSPEEAGRRVGEFLKGMQEGTGKAK